MESPFPPPDFPASILPGEGEERVGRILESITDGFCAFDAEWRFTFVNEAGKRLLAPHVGDPRTLLGGELWTVLPETRGSHLEREYRRATAEGVAIELEYFHAPWATWFAIRGFPIYGGGLSIYFRDVTEERRAAGSLRASEERYRSLFNSIDEGFSLIEIIWDAENCPADYRFIEVNPAFESQTGLRNPVGRTARELIPGLEAHWFEIYGKVARTGEATRFIQGSETLGRWFDVHASRLGAEGDQRVAILFTDITARRLAEVEIARLSAESRARLAEMEVLLEVLPVGIGIALDRECRHIRLNPAFARMLGLDPASNASKTAKASGLPWHFRVVDDSGREVPGEDLPMQVAAREGHEVREVELNIEQVDGRTLRLLEYAAPLFNERGESRGSVGAFVNITERRQSEERQRFYVALEDAVRPLSDPAEIVAVAARLLGEYLGADRCAYADVEADEDTMNLTGNYCRGVPSIVGRYPFSSFGAEVLRLMRADEPFVVEDIETHQPAPARFEAYQSAQIRAVICVPLHKGGKFVAAMAVHQQTPRRWVPEEVLLVQHVADRCWEALERVKVARVLAESEGRFRTLADHIAQLAWMGDAEGRLFWYNQRWFDYTGATLEQMQGWGWERVHHPEHIERVVEKWSRHLAAGESWEDTFPLRGADGQYRWFLSLAVPIRDAEGHVLRWFGTNTDVTEQRAGAEALARAKEEAEAANRSKDDFLAALSHELRTPLTPVLLSAAALQEDARLPDDVRAQLAMMRRNIELEARLIDDLLDVTRIARGKLALRVQACEVHSLVNLALEIVRDEAAIKGQTIELELNAQTTHFRGDPARMQQVFWNLLKNAVKYTPYGGRIAVASQDADGCVVVEVRDTGIGIGAEVLEHIFLPFEQAGLANDHRFGGLGLGLSISKTIVEMHAGSITAQSAGPYRGATFRVQLPAVERPPGLGQEQGVLAAAAGPQRPVAPLRILLVEDHEPTLAVLARLLARDGHQVATASSVAAAQACAAAQPLDAVISDIGLPDGTGIELMKGLRDTHGLRGIAVTGYGMEDDHRRTQAAGFVAHLTKPVDFTLLRRAIEELGPPATAAGPRG